MTAGPRFLSISLMMMLLFLHSFLRAVACKEVKLDWLILWYHLESCSCSFMRYFSKIVYFNGSWWGVLVLFFWYICGMYVDSSFVVSAFLSEYLVLIV